MVAVGILFPISLLILASFAKLFLPVSVNGFVWTDAGGGGGRNFWEFCTVFAGCVILWGWGCWLFLGCYFLVSFWILLFLGGLL